ncbi:MAG: hypothetical protein H6550_15870 [Chitinophagales bacterium]|nr:hypothetical protein [Chitinophagales bacterium]
MSKNSDFIYLRLTDTETTFYDAVTGVSIVRDRIAKVPARAMGSFAPQIKAGILVDLTTANGQSLWEKQNPGEATEQAAIEASAEGTEDTTDETVEDTATGAADGAEEEASVEDEPAAETPKASTAGKRTGRFGGKKN